MDSVTGPGKRTYSRPIFLMRNREQSLLFLLGHAWDGDPEAQEVLKLVFPDPSAEPSEQKPPSGSFGFADRKPVAVADESPASSGVF